MANLWVRTPDGYISKPISAFDATEASGDASRQGSLLVIPYRDGARSRYVLIDRSRTTRVNGSVVAEGIRMLQHKDELVSGNQRMYFSSQSLPVTEVFQLPSAIAEDSSARSPRRPRCPICRGSIEDGQRVVRCPGCLRVYHQITGPAAASEKPCWTYGPECRFCNHPTSLSGEGAWRPDQDSACDD